MKSFLTIIALLCVTVGVFTGCSPSSTPPAPGATNAAPAAPADTNAAK